MRVTVSGTMIAESTAAGTRRSARWNQTGTLMRSSRAMNDSRVAKVTTPARTMVSQSLQARQAHAGLRSTSMPARMPMRAAASSPVL